MDKFPRCGERKTTAHIMACKEQATVQWFNNATKDLDQWMIKENMNPNI